MNELMDRGARRRRAHAWLAWSSGKDSAYSFAWDGPMFRHPIPVHVGPAVARDGFVYSDLTPAGDARVS